MNTQRLKTLLAGATGALLLAWVVAVRAQEAPAAPVAPAVTPTPAAEAPAAAVAPEPAAAPAPAVEAEAADEKNDTSKPAKPERKRPGEIVSIGGDASLDEGGHAETVVAVLGDVRSAGEVDQEVVAVLGNVTATGKVGGEVVAVLGNVEIDGPVRGQVVAVLGNVTLGPKAEIGGEIVSIGGKIHKHPAAKLHSSVQEVGGFAHLPDFSGLRAWFKHCAWLGRPLAFVDGIGWAWAIAGVLTTLYLLLSLAFGRAVDRCAEVLERSPGQTILAAILTMLAAPFALIILAITGVGPFVLLLALFFAALFGKAGFLNWVGRRFLKPLGIQLPVATTALGAGVVTLLYCVPFVGVFVLALGGFLGLGMAVYALLGAIKRDKPAGPGRGAPLPPVAPLAPTSPAVPTMPVMTAPPVPADPASASAASAGFVAPAAPVVVDSLAFAGPVPPPSPVGPHPIDPAPVGGSASVPPPLGAAPLPRMATAPVPPPLRISATLLPRVGFWHRLAASLLDAILVGMVLGLTGVDGFFVLLYATYCVVLWALKGTTVGGIVCGLKVVRLDDRPIDWQIAIVRALGGFLSLFAAGLGFIWVAFDDDVQSWHDKIAGTTVVRVPKGTSLV